MDKIFDFFYNSAVVSKGSLLTATIIALITSLTCYMIGFRNNVSNIILYKKQNRLTKKERKALSKKTVYPTLKETLLRFLKWLLFLSYEDRDKRHPILYVISIIYNYIYLLISAVYFICLIFSFIDFIEIICFVSLSIKIFILDIPILFISVILFVAGLDRHPEKFMYDKPQ